MIGVHTPEFPFERDAGNVADAIERDGLTYPVVQDNDYGTWNAFGNQYWPAKYLIDSSGEVRYVHFGEGDYDQTEDAIRSLLAEGGPVGSARRSGRRRARRSEAAHARDLPRRRARSGVDELARRVAPPRQPRLRRIPGGRRHRTGSPIPAAGTSPTRAPSRSTARASTPPSPRAGSSSSSAHPIRTARSGCCSTASRSRPRDAGDDVEDGVVTVGAQRLYDLVDLPQAGTHTLTLEFDPGIEGYAFTFG